MIRVLFILTFLFCEDLVSQQDNYCLTDQRHVELLRNNPEFKAAYERFEQRLHEQAIEQRRLESSSSLAYTIPVVLHVVSPPGIPIGSGNNITEDQAELGISFLNDIFANAGRFNASTGVDTEISFCLAKRDPQNRPTNGINRIESSLVNDAQCMPGTDQGSERMIKSLIDWNCREYLNIWLVTDLYSGAFGCGLAGFAYLPVAQCGVDGIMMESRYWYTPGGAFITAHEVGHYLGLLHTFQGGCRNNDCLIDGDRVCDTPPDGSASFAACNTNSCNTDSPDVPDDNTNIMDYSNCQPMHFTQGQTDRMQNVMAGPRNSLSQSDACLPVVNLDVALVDIQNIGGICSDSFCLRVRFKNVGLDDITFLKIDHQIDGGIWLSQVWNGLLRLNESVVVELACSSTIPGPHQVVVDLVSPNNQVDEFRTNNVRSFDFTLYSELGISIVDLQPAKCQSNGLVEFSTIGGTPPYTYGFETGQPLQTSSVFSLLTKGSYQVTVTDQNGCIDSLPVTIPDSCKKDTPRDFVLNRDATYNGNTCYTITRDRTSRAGSLWYEDLITLEEDFVASFEMNLGCRDASGADGIAFLFQPISTSIGVIGGGIGYQGINPSIAVEFDTWQNTNYADPSYDHMSIMANGDISHRNPGNLAGPVGIIPSRGNVEDCNWRNVIVTWESKKDKLTVLVECNERLTYTGEIIDRFFGGNPWVFFGFTAATGGATNVHQVCLNYINITDKILSDTICKGDVIEKSAPSVFLNYEWTPATGVSDVNVFNPIFSPDTTTTYYVKMSGGCYDVIDSMTIYVVDLKIKDVITSPDSCGQTATMVEIIPQNQDSLLRYSIDGINYQSSNMLIGQEGLNTVYMKLGRCVTTSLFTIKKTPVLGDSLIFQSPETCKELGTLIVSGVSGTPPYEYSINGGTWGPVGQFDFLLSGPYTYAIRDQRGCVVLGNVFISNFKNSFVISIDSSDLRIDCCSPENYIEVSLSNQLNPFYSLDGANYSLTNRFTNLAEGDHFIVAKNDLDCPSDTLWFEIERYESSITNVYAQFCSGRDTLINGKVYNTTGEYIDSIPLLYCCDSILKISIDVDDVPFEVSSYVLCQGESIIVGTHIYDQSGTYLDTILRLGECDSLVQSIIEVIPVTEESSFYEICQGDVLNLGHRIVTISGMFSDTLSNIRGCDSIIKTEVIVNKLDTNNMSVSGCPGTTVLIDGQEFSQSGNYQIALMNVHGCDSLVQLELEIYQEFEEVRVFEICLGETVATQGVELGDTGIYTFDYQSAHGCDSVYQVAVRYKNRSECDDLKKIYIPNVFTPDQDGLNDRFTIFGNDQLKLILTLDIYSRWGEHIFTGADFPPNNTAYGWDGNLDNEKMLPGVYVYTTTVELVSGSVFSYKGDVTLIR